MTQDYLPYYLIYWPGSKFKFFDLDQISTKFLYFGLRSSK